MAKKQRRSSILLLAAILTGIWYLLSGMFDLLHFGVGVVVALLIAVNYVPVADEVPFRLGRFLLYVPWLIGQVVLSNMRVARAVLNPKMPIAPAFVATRPGVRGPRALTLLGSSITLTPGTVTVVIGEGDLFVHALDAASAQDIRDGVIAERVARVFPAGDAS